MKNRISERGRNAALRFKLLAVALGALFYAGLRDQRCTANAEGTTGTHAGAFTRKADAALAAPHLLLKQGTDAFHVAVAGASDIPIGTSTDASEAAEDIINVFPLNIGGTRRFRCITALAANIDLYTAAAGQVSALSGSAGTYYKVGRSVALAVLVGTNDYIIEAMPCMPVTTVVP